MTRIFTNQLIETQPLATKLLSAAVEGNKLLPAYLFTGRTISGKWEIAKQLASYLNCSKADKQEQGSCVVNLESAFENWCVNCRWVSNDEHPQALLKLSGAGSKSGKIAVEKAREFCGELAKSSQYYRVVVVEDASQDIFHRPAANALLKTIEEPKPSILLLFFALASSDVLPTVVSRCQVLELTGASLAENNIWSLSGVEAAIKNSQENEDLTLNKLIAEMAHPNRHQALVKSTYLAEKLQEIIEEEELSFDQVIDALIGAQLQELKQNIAHQPQLVSYAQDLLSLAESAKTQSRHFVSKKATTESFAYAWCQLQTKLKSA